MMHKMEAWSLMVTGYWNRNIFLPEWTIPRFFESGEQPAIEVGILPVHPIVYHDGMVRMEVTFSYLIFRPKTFHDDCLLRCEAMAKKAIEELPQTPMHAVGVNFGYREQHTANQISSMFNHADEGGLEQRRWTIGERKLTRKLTRDELALNLTTTFTPQSVDFDFNFHSDVSQGDGAALQAVERGRIIWLRDVAEAVLRETYDAEIEANDADTHG